MNHPTLPFFNNLTPMMKQYFSIKHNYPEIILFYRMGDFYEMFFEDAKKAASILGIALTKRGQHLGEDIPMCGVPFHSSDVYISKLIEAGNKVAICEQMETPEEAKKRGYSSIVRREVVRVITAGTITEDNLLEGSSSNFLLSIAGVKDEIAMSWTDISTGEFYTSLSKVSSLSSDLCKISPKEIIISDKLYQEENLISSLIEYRRIITIQASSLFDLNKAEHSIRTYYNIISSEVFGSYTDAELIACGAIIEYIILTSKSNQLKINYPKRLDNSSFMAVDPSTRKSLEINISSNGAKKGSLLELIDKTKTNCGSRLLSQYLNSPLLDVGAINNRLDMVEFFVNNLDLTSDITSILPSIGDIERSLSRFSFNRAGPRDLQVIKNSFVNSNKLLSSFYSFRGGVNAFLEQYLICLKGFDSLMIELDSALSEDLPLLVRDGNFIKEGYNVKLDQLNDLKRNSKQMLQALKQKYIDLTGINSLKISHNNVLGYFIDITPQHNSKIKDELFIHRQTLANSIRYTTLELKELEKELAHLSSNIISIEIELYNKLVSDILDKSQEISLFSRSIAVIDVATSLASLAIQNNYCRPVIDNSERFSITDGRHPVIERSLVKEKQEFIVNDCSLESGKNLWLITGPNMAGKSTFLRQNALIAIMGQIGSFVPARKAKFGVVDKVFSRVGASDDLARGRSTFMVEMVETANILNNATKRSLIILDEIGRGTSTYDGVSIASACLEFIHDKIEARALFATHYHELTALEKKLQSLCCYSMQIKEWNNKVIFLHKVVSGVSDKSYGIHVAELAGLPREVVQKAEQTLERLETERFSLMNLNFDQKISNKKESLVENTLKAINLDDISPKEALEVLYKLKDMVKI